jgi:glucose-6-phosphate isomerase
MEINLKNLAPDIRRLNDVRNVLHDQEWLKAADNIELYYMYRGIEKKGDLRYDVTIIPAKMLGSEFVKTKGHYHIGAWPELYTVLEGQAIYLLQKKNSSGGIENAYAVKAEKGDVVIMPPFYGHVTINPSETQELKMANWISDNCKSDYSDFEKLQGACYYYILQPGSGQATWIKNKNYKSVPELRFEEPQKSVPENLDFLKQG